MRQTLKNPKLVGAFAQGQPVALNYRPIREPFEYHEYNGRTDLSLDPRQLRHGRLDLHLHANIGQREENILRHQGDQIDEVLRTEDAPGLFP